MIVKGKVEEKDESEDSIMWITEIVIVVTALLSLHSLMCEGRYFDSYDYSLIPEDMESEDVPSTRDLLLSPFPFTPRSNRVKRRLFDSNCKGIYNREAIDKLDSVCDACYNLYRKPYIASECRKECYNNGLFESCLYDLMMHDVAHEYTSMVRVLDIFLF
ncbi:Crustacean hyperglycemic hormone [Armadillidium vulgare]|nr:Crustacean hyperglycemic hormone [Armadillidium vulgare]